MILTDTVKDCRELLDDAFIEHGGFTARLFPKVVDDGKDGHLEIVIDGCTLFVWIGMPREEIHWRIDNMILHTRAFKAEEEARKALRKAEAQTAEAQS